MSNIITGVTSGTHDAAITKIRDGEILIATHAERHSRIKNDGNLYPGFELEGTTVFYERPFIKNTRRIYAGQSWQKVPAYDKYVPHHWSHASAAYYTRPFTEEPVCVVIDAIGEWDTATIWYNKKKVWSMRYPESLGLFYSAVTARCGLKPMEDEYIVMGMAAYGNDKYTLDPYKDYHRGMTGQYCDYDLATSAQKTLETEVLKIMTKARTYSEYLCYGGGVALNCVANSLIRPLFKDMWIMPNPGDAGSSLGAAAAYYGKQLNWTDPYLGTNIERDVDVKEVVKHLLDYLYCGIANGKAEFGPRALGNRSLIADPRKNIKDTINDIKKRQRFRPFAPCILEEYADEYFEGPMNEYMQYVSKAKHDHDAVTHVDGTARVQVVKKDCKSIIRPILEEWYEQTKCPMLLNTSLNIKGQPIVDTLTHADEFERKYKCRIF